MTPDDRQADKHILSEFFFIRHGLRLDQIDREWQNNSPTPYDSPIARQGYIQSVLAGQAIAQHSATQKRPRFIIHTSPFLRCIQTALAIASALAAKHNLRPILRIDSCLGEWITPDYYIDIPAPPSMLEMSRNAHYYLSRFTPSTTEFGPRWKEVLPIDTSCVDIDVAWDSELFGSGGEYGEEWPDMHARFRASLRQMIKYYSTPPAKRKARGISTRGDEIIVMVTHGAGCNAMISAVTGRPVLKDVGLASLSHAVAVDAADPRSISSQYCLLMAASTDHLDVLTTDRPVSRELGRSGSWHNNVTRTDQAGLWSSKAVPTRPPGIKTRKRSFTCGYNDQLSTLRPANAP